MQYMYSDNINCLLRLRLQRNLLLTKPNTTPPKINTAMIMQARIIQTSRSDDSSHQLLLVAAAAAAASYYLFYSSMKLPLDSDEPNNLKNV